MSLILEPFGYDYMARAIWVCALVGAMCAFLSVFLMLKGWSLIGDALSHSVVPGIAVSAMFGWPLALGAFATGIFAAGAMLLLDVVTRLRSDTVIGLVFTSFFALGLFLVSISPVPVDIQMIIQGNILAIAPDDLAQLVAIGALVIATLALKWRDLMAMFFDEDHARSIGLPMSLLKGVFFILLSAACVAAFQTVGAFLIIALLVTPGATAYLLADRFSRVIAIAVLIGTASAGLGAWASYFLDLAPGGLIVCLQAAIFLTAFVAAPKHGVLAARGRMRSGVPEGR